jgi:nucleoside-diphosphate-sugar epimerase
MSETIDKDVSILVTGGRGFLGKALVRALHHAGYENISYDHNSHDYDLRSESQTKALFDHSDPDVVFHLAARVGGIGANRAQPATFWHDNLVMGANVLRASRARHVAKVVMVGTTCSYPKTPGKIPFPEEELFNGYPEETNAPYGIAKLALLEGARAYRNEFGLNVVTAVPTNLYGPHDDFMPATSHVIPALMLKMHYAMTGDRARTTGEHGEIVVWGDGRSTRDFLYVDDAANGLVVMMEKYDDVTPINLGSGKEISINELFITIAEVAGYHGQARLDKTKPNGQPRRALDITRARQILGWEPIMSLSEGLKKTWDWFIAQPR